MAISEALVVNNDDRQHVREARETAALTKLASTSLVNLSSQDTSIIVQIKAFVEWLNDPRPVFADALDGDDKFATLIELSRAQQDCTNFYASEVGVNASTVWRWSTGKSRPSRYVGKRLAQEIHALLRSALFQMADERGLL